LSMRFRPVTCASLTIVEIILLRHSGVLHEGPEAMELFGRLTRCDFTVTDVSTCFVDGVCCLVDGLHVIRQVDVLAARRCFLNPGINLLGQHVWFGLFGHCLVSSSKVISSGCDCTGNNLCSSACSCFVSVNRCWKSDLPLMAPAAERRAELRAFFTKSRRRASGARVYVWFPAFSASSAAPGRISDSSSAFWNCCASISAVCGAPVLASFSACL